MTETEIRAEILKYLKSLPDCRVRAQQRQFKNRPNQTEKGWPDVSGYYKRWGLFIEVKKPGGTLTLEQMEFIQTAQKHGHIAFFATSVEDVKKALTSHSRAGCWACGQALVPSEIGVYPTTKG